VLDVGGGGFTTYDDPGQGAFIGLTTDHLITFADCLGLPCDVLSNDIATGEVALLADEASGATFAAGADGRGTVSIETVVGTVEVSQ
jgi:hypothetical protein